MRTKRKPDEAATEHRVQSYNDFDVVARKVLEAQQHARPSTGKLSTPEGAHRARARRAIRKTL